MSDTFIKHFQCEQLKDKVKHVRKSKLWVSPDVRLLMLYPKPIVLSAW